MSMKNKKIFFGTVSLILLGMMFLAVNAAFDPNKAWHTFDQLTIPGASNTQIPIYVTTAENVGIGTTGPGYKLDVNGAIRTNSEFISTNSNQLRMVYGNYGTIWRNDGTNTYLLLTASGDQYGNWNSLRPLRINDATGDVSLGNNQMYVQHNGNVGIGTITPSYKLDVNGDVQASGFFYSSDERLKNEVTRLDDALDKVSALEGVKFTWKQTGDRSIGLIAQDVEEVLPELVHTDAQGYKSVEYGNVVAVLIEAVKEQQKQIDDLKEKVDSCS